jgi:cobalt-zinc-cadmium efflux system outer membrane protein
MSPGRLIPFAGLLLLSGCLWPVQEKADHVVCDLAAHPFDRAPDLATDALLSAPPTASPSRGPSGLPMPNPVLPQPGKVGWQAAPTKDVRTVALLQPDRAEERPARRIDLKIPPAVPGAEAKRIELPKDPEKKAAEVRRIYPPLPPLPELPKALPGPHGRPYTLADLQQIAAANSPTLRQAAFDVQSAEGALIQARTYPNPTMGIEQDPSNNGSTAGLIGVNVDQVIKTGGKLKLAAAAARMDLENARLALKRARSDLATSVRTAYFALLVARETVLVNRGLAVLTDEVYRYQAIQLESGFAAPYEPAALRAQAYSTRLAYVQAISTSVYAWKQLVAALGLQQLPLTEVAGRVDRLFPNFDYDAVLQHVIRNHTDVLTARNTIAKARYNLKLTQVTPVPDVDVHFAVLKETALPPFQWAHMLSVTAPIPIWDQNKGNIIAAQGALGRALEEPHRVEVALTNTLATNYTTYKTNLDGLEYYRRHILPDQVRYYRGIFARRDVDPASAFNDLVTAQQTLATNVGTYLGILASLWSSAVQVADQLQTDDLFQFAKPQELPPLPDLSTLPAWPCRHDCHGHGGP